MVDSVCELIAGAAARVTVFVLLGALLRPALPVIRRFRLLARPLAQKFARLRRHLAPPEADRRLPFAGISITHRAKKPEASSWAMAVGVWILTHRSERDREQR